MGVVGKALIITAPSGAGKTTIVRSLMSQFSELAFSISATTRSPRKGESHGTHYYFLSQAEFMEAAASGALMEYEEVYSGMFYGTLRSEVEQLWSQDKVVVFDVDVKGAVRLKEELNQQALSIFIAPPSLESLKQRLIQRGTETEESLQKRLERSAEEMTYAARFDATVVNDDLEVAIAETATLLREFLH